MTDNNQLKKFVLPARMYGPTKPQLAQSRKDNVIDEKDGVNDDGLTVEKSSKDFLTIQCYPPKSIANLISLSNGLAPDELQVTLFTLSTKELSINDVKVIASILEGFTESTKVKFTGKLEKFESNPGFKDNPYVLTIESTELENLRSNMCDLLDRAGIAYSREYAFYPHITLGYFFEEPIVMALGSSSFYLSAPSLKMGPNDGHALIMKEAQILKNESETKAGQHEHPGIMGSHSISQHHNNPAVAHDYTTTDPTAEFDDKDYWNSLTDDEQDDHGTEETNITISQIARAQGVDYGSLREKMNQYFPQLIDQYDIGTFGKGHPLTRTQVWAAHTLAEMQQDTAKRMNVKRRPSPVKRYAPGQENYLGFIEGKLANNTMDQEEFDRLFVLHQNKLKQPFLVEKEGDGGGGDGGGAGVFTSGDAGVFTPTFGGSSKKKKITSLPTKTKNTATQALKSWVSKIPTFPGAVTVDNNKITFARKFIAKDEGSLKSNIEGVDHIRPEHFKTLNPSEDQEKQPPKSPALQLLFDWIDKSINYSAPIRPKNEKSPTEDDIPESLDELLPEDDGDELTKIIPAAMGAARLAAGAVLQNEEKLPAYPSNKGIENPPETENLPEYEEVEEPPKEDGVFYEPEDSEEPEQFVIEPELTAEPEPSAEPELEELPPPPPPPVSGPHGDDAANLLQALASMTLTNEDVKTFLKTVSLQYNDQKFISDKQYEALMNIYIRQQKTIAAQDLAGA
jgi:hypothetical protein